MRKAEGKLNGYIILPVVVPSGEDAAAALDRNDAYSHVWEVLQALRSHDERFDAYVNKLDMNKSNDGPISVIGVGSKGDDEEAEDVRGVAEARVFQRGLDFDLADCAMPSLRKSSSDAESGVIGKSGQILLLTSPAATMNASAP